MEYKIWFLLAAALVASGCSPSADGVGNRSRDLPLPTTQTKLPSGGGDEAEPTAWDRQANAEKHLESAPASVESQRAESTSAEVNPANNAGQVAKRTEAQAAGKESEPIAVTFEDLNLNMQADIVYRPVMMTERVRELEGKRIKLKGVMHPDAKLKKIKEFVLLKNIECKFGPGGQADHLAEIEMQGDATANFTNRPVEVEGVLRIAPYQGIDGNTWSIFRIEATSVRGG